MKKKVYFSNTWVSLDKLVEKLKKLGFVEGKDFGETDLIFKGVPVFDPVKENDQRQ